MIKIKKQQKIENNIHISPEPIITKKDEENTNKEKKPFKIYCEKLNLSEHHSHDKSLNRWCEPNY